jgi:hypothetical protein
MSTATAQRFLLERLGQGSTVLLAILLALVGVAVWADGRGGITAPGAGR